MLKKTNKYSTQELQHKLDQENEIVKVWLKREKNRLAATKCR